MLQNLSHLYWRSLERSDALGNKTSNDYLTATALNRFNASRPELKSPIGYFEVMEANQAKQTAHKSVNLIHSNLIQT